MCWFRLLIIERNLTTKLDLKLWTKNYGLLKSPDQNPLDFFYWGYLKDKLFKEQLNFFTVYASGIFND